MNRKNNNYSKKMDFDDYVLRAFNDDFFEDDDFGFGGFGGFGRLNSHKMIGNDDGFGFFGGLGSNIMSEFGSFNNLGSGKQGSVITKSYVSSINYDKNGNPQKQEFSSQSIDQYNKDGTKLSEKKHAFKDSTQGIKKASHQRMLNDQGHKIVKTRDYKNNHESEDHYYKGMEEKDSTNFHNKFKEISDKTNYRKNYEILDKYNNRLPQEKPSKMNKEPLKLGAYKGK